jgi:hypothetical protein
MKISIIADDKTVCINGVCYGGLDLSLMPSNIHAVQWYGTEGDVEIKDARGRMVENRAINSFDEFAFVIPLWEAAKAKKEAEDLANQQEIERLIAARQ